jgi:hypothetical protein
MKITGEISAIVAEARNNFEQRFKESLVTDSLRQVITKSMPASEVETKRLNDPEFREKFNNILSPITQEVIDKFQNVGQFDTGNLFSSMINSISDSVSLESQYRANCIFNDIEFDRITGSVEAAIAAKFEKNGFTSKDIGLRAVEDFKNVLSMEDAEDILDDIKNEVKSAIDETEDKNKLVEGTTKEIIDYKKEIAPPDDQYDNPEGVEGDNNEDDDAGKTTDSDSSDDSENQENEVGESDNSDDGTDASENEETPELDNEADQSGENQEDLGSDGDTGETSDTGETPDVGNTDAGDESAIDDADSTDVNINDMSDGSEEPQPEPQAGEAADTPNENGEKEAEQSPSTSGNSGIVINITGADLVKAKEALSFKTAELYAREQVPTHPRLFDEMKLPNVEDMAAEACAVTGDLNREFGINFDSLKYGIRQLRDAKSEESLMAKLDELKTISSEAFKLSNSYTNTLYDAGLSPDGLVDSRENTFFCAANVIKLVAGTRKISPEVQSFESDFGVLANAFDILQLRKECKNAVESVDQAKADELFARENLFYKNIATIDDKDLRKQATAVIDMTDMKLEKTLTTNFITDYKIKAWEVNVGKNANKTMNETVTNRVKESFKKLWGRDLNESELEIVNAVTNNQDVTNIAPSPYEKFVIKLSKESLIDQSAESGPVKLHLTAEDKANIKFKAKLYTTLVKAVEHFGILDENDEWAITNFCEGLK